MLDAAAVFDTLINARDRSFENVFITRAGRLTMIDTLTSAFEYNAGPVDSVFVPATKLFMKAADDPLHRFHPRLWLVDYRCFASGGSIGRAYPPRMHRCLAQVASGEALLPELNGADGLMDGLVGGNAPHGAPLLVGAVPR